MTIHATTPQPSTGTSIVGTHHASGMFDSVAPARIAMRNPSPVFVRTDTGWVSGVRTKLRTKSASHSKPPVANTTPWRAETSNGPSADSRRTPTTRPSRMTSSRAAVAVRGSIERSRHAQPTDEGLARPASRRGSRCGNPVESGVPERGLAHAIRGAIWGPTLTRGAHAPSSSNGNSGHSSERPPFGFPPGCSGW